MQKSINIFWFRRDLRLDDNAALYHALRAGNPVLPLFIFDRHILDQLEEKKDSRVTFIHDVILAIRDQLVKDGRMFEIRYGFPEEIFAELLQQYKIEKVFANHDYEPYATERDEAVKKILNAAGVSFHTYKDQVIFEKSEIIKDNDTPYHVFTPYSRKWLAELNEFYLKAYPTLKYGPNFLKGASPAVPTLKMMGFKRGDQEIPSSDPTEDIIQHYGKRRDYPGSDGTSRLGIHLRFGTVSIRALANRAKSLSAVYLNELIWREFYQMLLWHYPKLGKGRAFRKEFEAIKWRNNEEEFKRWCEGSTGYPLVDAGMRQLNQTGYIHNRVRMVVASFLSKHLLIDWRWGEAYFAGKLLDFELASNNGGWQWAAGSGCDAAPYFRVFNPTLQAKKFDPQKVYIRRWVPEMGTDAYPLPIVEHEFARKRCLAVFSKAVKRNL